MVAPVASERGAACRGAHRAWGLASERSGRAGPGAERDARQGTNRRDRLPGAVPLSGRQRGPGAARAPRRPIRGVRASLARPPRPPARRTGCGFGRLTRHRATFLRSAATCAAVPCLLARPHDGVRPSRGRYSGYAWPVPSLAPVPAPGRGPSAAPPLGREFWRTARPGCLRHHGEAQRRRPGPEAAAGSPRRTREEPSWHSDSATRPLYRPAARQVVEVALGQGAGLRIAARQLRETRTASPGLSAKPAPCASPATLRRLQASSSRSAIRGLRPVGARRRAHRG